MKQWPNMLLIAGTGRNVGKTTFACKIIQKTARQNLVIAIKITPHIHDICSSCITLYKSDDLIITEETNPYSDKDSSKMLAAGAHKVYFIQAGDTQLQNVIDFIQLLLPRNCAIVCESAALRNYIEPGIFILMSKNPDEQLIKNADKIELADRHIFDYNYDTKDFKFFNNTWKFIK